MQYTEKELNALIANVEKEFTAHLAKAELLAKSEDAGTAPLVKAEDAQEEKKDEKSDEKPEQKEEAKDEQEASEKDEASAEDSEESQEASSEAKESDEEAPAKEEQVADDESHDYDDQDLDHMNKMYSSMSKGELKAHHDSIKACLDSRMAKCGDMSMSKSEDAKPVEVPTEVIQQESDETKLLKSELEAEKAKTEGLQKTLDAVTAFITKFAEKVEKKAPQAKAVTSYDAIAKSEGAQEEKTLTKAEIDSALLKKSADPKLAKSDRDAINAYYLNGASTNTITHLLK